MVLQLNQETEDATLLEKITVYQRANKEVKYVILDKKHSASSLFLTLSNVLIYSAGRYNL
jgi:hypothetical protein